MRYDMRRADQDDLLTSCGQTEIGVGDEGTESATARGFETGEDAAVGVGLGFVPEDAAGEAVAWRC